VCVCVHMNICIPVAVDVMDDFIEVFVPAVGVFILHPSICMCMHIYIYICTCTYVCDGVSVCVVFCPSRRRFHTAPLNTYVYV